MINQAVLEAGAKALYETRGLHRSTGREWDRAVPADRYTCERDARAVLEAANTVPHSVVLDASQVAQVTRLLQNASKIQAIAYVCKTLDIGPIKATSLVNQVETKNG